MKFAVVDGQKQEAQPGLSGECQGCQRPMVAKCGERRTWHWAHLTKRNCDPWWENEGEWHRAWKSHFPESWQEIVHSAESGEKHIADVKTAHGWVIEFQHSAIKPEERRSRDAFYGKLVWVVDGTRLKKAKKQFERSWEDGVRVGPGVALRKLYRDECALLREWAGGSTPIFFDFADEQTLWWLLASRSDGWDYVGHFPRAQFIDLHRTPEEARGFGNFVNDFLSQLANYEAMQRADAEQRARLQHQENLHRYFAWSRRRGRL